MPQLTKNPIFIYSIIFLIIVVIGLIIYFAMKGKDNYNSALWTQEDISKIPEVIGVILLTFYTRDRDTLRYVGDKGTTCVVNKIMNAYTPDEFNQLESMKAIDNALRSFIEECFNVKHD